RCMQAQRLADKLRRLELQLIMVEQGGQRLMDQLARVAVAALENPAQFAENEVIDIGRRTRARVVPQPGLGLGGLPYIVVGEQSHLHVCVERDNFAVPWRCVSLICSAFTGCMASVLQARSCPR